MALPCPMGLIRVISSGVEWSGRDHCLIIEDAFVFLPIFSLHLVCTSNAAGYYPFSLP